MATKTLAAALPNILRRGPPPPARWSRAFAVDPRSIQGTPGSQEKFPVEEPATDENARGIASAAAQQVEQSIGKAVEDAWGSAKEKAQLVKDAVEGKTENAAETIRQNAEVVERAMNTKNRS